MYNKKIEKALGRKSPYIDLLGNAIYENHIISNYQAEENIVEFNETLGDTEKDQWWFGNYHASFLPLHGVARYSIIVGVYNKDTEEEYFYTALRYRWLKSFLNKQPLKKEEALLPIYKLEDIVQH